MKTLSAHYDGKHIVLDEPVLLPPNTHVTVIVGEVGESGAEITDWCNEVAQNTFNKIWDNPLDASYDKH